MQIDRLLKLTQIYYIYDDDDDDEDDWNLCIC